MGKEKISRLPQDIQAIRNGLRTFLNQHDEEGRTIGASKYGIYAFYDYDGEPIYVGQTLERLRGRIGRHLTNQRTDAVAMNVLDPLEVAEVEVWPFYFTDKTPEEIKQTMDAAEYAVFQKMLRESTIGAILNEKDPPEKDPIDLPPSFRSRIIPPEVWKRQNHPDIRISRRANTIANLARVISEREVSGGLRRTLLTQARRLELLASKRLSELGLSSSFDIEDEEQNREAEDE